MDSVILLVGTGAVWTMLTSTVASEMSSKTMDMTGAEKTYQLVGQLLLLKLCVILALFGYQERTNVFRLLDNVSDISFDIFLFIFKYITEPSNEIIH